MTITQEKDWREIFQVEEVDNFNLKTETVDGCNANCLEAKEIKCVCRCRGKNHGSVLRNDVKPLNTILEQQIGQLVETALRELPGTTPSIAREVIKLVRKLDVETKRPLRSGNR
jgi:hypothetical protein